jgi:hypothetical protein
VSSEKDEREMTMYDCPEPGIYPSIPFEAYCQWDAINHSRLARIDKSPLHAQTSPDFSGSDSIRFGHLVHSGRLEPQSVASRYAVMPAYEFMPENTTGKGEWSNSTATAFVKTSRAAFTEQAETDGKIVVKFREFAKMQRTLAVILDCPEAAECFINGQPELSIVWDDRTTGLRCKARIDYQQPDRLVDLKTSRDDGKSPLPEAFEWSLWSYNYYSQAAWYQSGWETLTGDKLPFWFCVVANTDPIQCIAAPVGEMSLMAGRQKNSERMELWESCERSGKWPGYRSPVLFELPDKYFPEEES